MSSMNSYPSKFDSVDSVLHYLQEPSSPEVVSSTTTSSVVGSTRVYNESKSTKKQKKEKELANYLNATQTNSIEAVQMLSTGRVRYGPITVNPRKQPSKTLFTGRRSKNEILIGEEEEKRRLRRERNRVAATKCREKRESVLSKLEAELSQEANKYTHLIKVTQQLEQQKQYLQSIFSNHIINCPLQKINPTPPPQQPTMVFCNTGFLPSIVETQPTPLVSSHQIQFITNDEKEFSRFLQPSRPELTNSAYNINQSNQFFLPEQQSQQQTITMTSSSLDRLLSGLPSPTISFIDNNNNNSCSGLFNSAYGTSSCAQQHSNSSEDEPLPPTHGNSYVC